MKEAEEKRKGVPVAVISMKALLESGVHFGHRTHKWHPGMKPYIFTERNGIHIIDLQKTAKAIEQAYALIRNTVAEGGVVLFVGTKRQAQETVQNEAVRCGMPHVTIRWLGGMLTNWRTIRQRINELERLEHMRDTGEFGRLTKKEGLIISREIERLQLILGGIRNLVKLPDLVFVVDVHREATAIREANILNIPVVAMVDTNCDPSHVDYVIPSKDAVQEGRAARKEEEPEETARMAVVEEPELADEELLGEATLAKLSPKLEQFQDVELVLDEEELLKTDEPVMDGVELEELAEEIEEIVAEDVAAEDEEN
jgi:small subunit ribosomal protein S2